MIDSITNIENYNSLIKENYLDMNSKLKELFYEYIHHFHEHFQNNYTEYNKFVFIKGFQTITNVFYMLLLYLKNLEVAFLNSKQSIFYYVEFIGQIGEDGQGFLQLNSKDAILFVYKKTIFDINNDKKKNHSVNDNEKKLLLSLTNSIHLLTTSMEYILFHNDFNSDQFIFYMKQISKILEPLDDKLDGYNSKLYIIHSLFIKAASFNIPIDSTIQFLIHFKKKISSMKNINEKKILKSITLIQELQDNTNYIKEVHTILE
tara:strand:+ start:15692 stop:16474 length:783 start_codon:yes stop_codon:yes gene_type:complete